MRSLASESAKQLVVRMRSRDGGGVVLDWYAADFNEELSAFDGRLLHSQTAFVVAAIHHLLASRQSTRGVVVVGHSMGGVVGQAAATLPACMRWRADPVHASRDDEGCIRVLVTLAAPHARLPFVAQPAMATFYGELRRAWSAAPQRLPRVAVAAITSGERDVQVRARGSRAAWTERRGLMPNAPLSARQAQELPLSRSDSRKHRRRMRVDRCSGCTRKALI